MDVLADGLKEASVVLLGFCPFSVSFLCLLGVLSIVLGFWGQGSTEGDHGHQGIPHQAWDDRMMKCVERMTMRDPFFGLFFDMVMTTRDPHENESDRPLYVLPLYVWFNTHF